MYSLMVLNPTEFKPGDRVTFLLVREPIYSSSGVGTGRQTRKTLTAVQSSQGILLFREGGKRLKRMYRYHAKSGELTSAFPKPPLRYIIQEVLDVKHTNPGRPPKKWWKRCVAGVSESGSAADPASVCGATWARKSARERRASMREYENPERIIASADVPKRRGAAPAAIILVDRGSGAQPFVTWYYNKQDGGRYWGHYFDNEPAAWEDFKKRAAEYRARPNPGRGRRRGRGASPLTVERQPKKYGATFDVWHVLAGRKVIGIIHKAGADTAQTRTPWHAYAGHNPPFVHVGEFWGAGGQEKALAAIAERMGYRANPGPAWHRKEARELREMAREALATDPGLSGSLHKEAVYHEIWGDKPSYSGRDVHAKYAAEHLAQLGRSDLAPLFRQDSRAGYRMHAHSLRESKRNPEGADPVYVRELDLYAENTYELYNQFKSIIENLKRKIGRGVYDPAKAPRLWQYWYDEAARRYKKEFGGQVPVAVRKQAALERAAEEFNKIMAGEYGEIPVPKRLRKKNPLGTLTRGVQGLANPKRKTACAGYVNFHGKNPDKAYATKVPKGFPRRLWFLGRLHKLVLAGGQVLKGGVVAAGTGNTIYLLGVKGNVKHGRVERIEYVPPRNSTKSGAVYYHPFKSPPSITGYGRGYHRIAGRGVRLTPRGIIG